MSWNRTKYDPCAYRKELNQSVSSLGYTLDPNKYHNCHKCRHGFGLIGGNNVSVTMNNMVDVESDLLGFTRPLSDCPEKKYLPPCPHCLTTEDIQCPNCLPPPVQHLPECQMINYPPRINHIGYSLKYPGCPIQNIQSISGQPINGQPIKYPPQLNPIKWGNN